nr:hypothetical protein [Tanacetum cinerariifolium]
CNLHSSGFSFLLAVGTFFTSSGNFLLALGTFFWQWELYNWQWECLVHFIPNNQMVSEPGPLDTKENRIMDLKLEYQTFRAKSTESLSQTYTRYKTMLNELDNDGVNLSKYKINVAFVNNIYGRFVYEDKLIQRRILYHMICKREDHRTSYHKMYTALLKRSENYKAQPYQYASSSKQILKAKFTLSEALAKKQSPFGDSDDMCLTLLPEKVNPWVP